MCNKEIKFGIFYDSMRKQGYDFVATGHYVQINQGRLQRAKDESKDQSYFLWQIPKDHLEHILFPLGQMLKSEVRAKAVELGLSTASKPDSMGICFIGEVNVNKLLKDRLGENEGNVVMYPARPGLAGQGEKDLQGQALTGTIVGTHRGLWFYTIGERGGFEIDKQKLKKLGLHPEKMKPLYVIGKNIEDNQLIVGMREETMTNKIEVNSQIINSQILKLKTKLWVRIRNLGELIEVDNISGDRVTLKEKIFGVAEGQSAVFYDETGILVGGSIIV